MADVILCEDDESYQSKVTHIINLTSAQWALFWRLMVVGSVIADDLIDIYISKESCIYPSTAELWKRLSAEYIKIFDEDSHVYSKVIKGPVR